MSKLIGWVTLVILGIISFGMLNFGIGEIQHHSRPGIIRLANPGSFLLLGSFIGFWIMYQLHRRVLK